MTPQRRMFRSPDHYGYLTANVNLTLHGVGVRQLHGRMLVQHNAGYIRKDTSV
ncbi:MAG: hypothetical protein ACLRMJ_11160 [Alistipes finegoldii]